MLVYVMFCVCRLSSLFFAYDVLLASSNQDLQHDLGFLQLSLKHLEWELAPLSRRPRLFALSWCVETSCLKWRRSFSWVREGWCVGFTGELVQQQQLCRGGINPMAWWRSWARIQSCGHELKGTRNFLHMMAGHSLRYGVRISLTG